MFSIVYAFTLAGRAFPDPDRVVQLYARDARTTGDYRPFSYPVYQELAARSDSSPASSPTIRPSSASVTASQSRRAFVAVVSANYFDVLGVSLAAGPHVHGRRGSAR